MLGLLGRDGFRSFWNRQHVLRFRDNSATSSWVLACQLIRKWPFSLVAETVAEVYTISKQASTGKPKTSDPFTLSSAAVEDQLFPRLQDLLRTVAKKLLASLVEAFWGLSVAILSSSGQLHILAVSCCFEEGLCGPCASDRAFSQARR